MKKALLCMTAVAVMLTGCSKSNEQSNANSASENFSSSAKKAAADARGTIKSVIIAGGYWQLVEEGEDAGKMKWLDYAIAGTRVYAFESKDASSEVKYEVKKDVVRLTDGKKRDFVHITLEDNDLWVQDYSIAVDAYPGVVTGEKAWLYKKASPTDILTSSLPAGTIIGISREAIDDSNPFAEQFKKVYAYVDNTLISGNYLSVDDFIESYNIDIAINILTRLEETDKDGNYVLSNKTARDELFSILKTFCYKNYIHDRATALDPDFYPDFVEATK